MHSVTLNHSFKTKNQVTNLMAGLAHASGQVETEPGRSAIVRTPGVPLSS
jgi:hypothetical protein